MHLLKVIIHLNSLMSNWLYNKMKKRKRCSHGILRHLLNELDADDEYLEAGFDAKGWYALPKKLGHRVYADSLKLLVSNTVRCLWIDDKAGYDDNVFFVEFVE